jgi:hypothetical protein
MSRWKSAERLDIDVDKLKRQVHRLYIDKKIEAKDEWKSITKLNFFKEYIWLNKNSFYNMYYPKRRISYQSMKILEKAWIPFSSYEA